MNKNAILCFLLLLLPLSLGAQRLEDAERLYRNYLVEMGNQKQASAYSTLWECYQTYMSILQRSHRGETAYRQAKDGLLEVHSHLGSAAAYYNNNSQQTKALRYAQAYVDLLLSEGFKGETFLKCQDYPTIVYFASSGTYNAGDYRKAISYFNAYLQTGDEEFRKVVYAFMGTAYLNLNEYDSAINAFKEASDHYPSYMPVLSQAINACIKNDDFENLQPFLTLALRVEPQNKTLLNTQGMLFEKNYDYEQALDIYTRLRRLSPNSLPVARHVALNYYNLGVLNYNKAITEQTESLAKRYANEAEEFFYSAIKAIREVLASDPGSLKFSQALATAYSCLGDSKNLDAANATIYALGGQTVDSDIIPSLITEASSVAGGESVRQKASSNTLVLFSVFAKEYVETRVNQWQEKDPYETLSEYRERVNVKTRDAKIQALKKEAELKYIQQYTRSVKFNDMVLLPYDAERKVFRVKSQFGELVAPVPRENNEARLFESSWNDMRFRDPVFFISGDKLLLSSLTFITPTGKTYSFKSDRN